MLHKRMAENEVSDSDRIYELTREVLEAGMSAREVWEAVNDAIKDHIGGHRS